MIDGQPIEVGDNVAIDRLVEREQPGLVGEQLAHRDALLAACANSGQYVQTRSS